MSGEPTNNYSEKRKDGNMILIKTVLEQCFERTMGLSP